MQKENYFSNSVSSDISFCASDCKNNKCSRNTNSDIHQRANKEWISYAMFNEVCSEYQR